MIAVQVLRILPVIGLVGGIAMLMKLSPMNKEIWSTEGISDIREGQRGTFVSICSALLMTAVAAIMANMGVPSDMIVTNYGFVLGPVIGYMLDIGIGTDKGLRKTKEGFYSGASHVFSSLISGDFLRYIITVFLDMFISGPLLDILNLQATKLQIKEALTKSSGIIGKYDKVLSENFPSILQSIIGFITFEAYTNQTRFAWAYPNDRLPKEKRIRPATIMLSTAIAGVAFIGFYKLLAMSTKSTKYGINSKIMFVVAAIGLLYLLSSTGMIQAEVKQNDKDSDEQDADVTEDTSTFTKLKPAIGLAAFIAIFIYGLIYPIMAARR